MAVERCTAVLLALAAVTSYASAASAASATVVQPPLELGGNATDGHDVMEANHHGSDEPDKPDDLASGLASVKALVDITLAFLSAAIQVKGFGLSVVNTVVNVGRFLIELYAARGRPHAVAPPLSYSYSTYF